LAYDWNEIKARYETGNYSMKNLSDEYGFNESYGHRKSSEEGWEKGKTKEKVSKKTQKRMLEAESKTEADVRGENIDIVSKIKLAMASELFEKETDFNRLKQLKIASEILTNCKTLEWELYQFNDNYDSENEGLKALAEVLGKARGKS